MLQCAVPFTSIIKCRGHLGSHFTDIVDECLLLNRCRLRGRFRERDLLQLAHPPRDDTELLFDRVELLQGRLELLDRLLETLLAHLRLLPQLVRGARQLLNSGVRKGKYISFCWDTISSAFSFGGIALTRLRISSAIEF